MIAGIIILVVLFFIVSIYDGAAKVLNGGSQSVSEPYSEPDFIMPVAKEPVKPYVEPVVSEPVSIFS